MLKIADYQQIWSKKDFFEPTSVEIIAKQKKRLIFIPEVGQTDQILNKYSHVVLMGDDFHIHTIEFSAIHDFHILDERLAQEIKRSLATDFNSRLPKKPEDPRICIEIETGKG